jgi:hypothetical protein
MSSDFIVYLTGTEWRWREQIVPGSEVVPSTEHDCLRSYYSPAYRLPTITPGIVAVSHWPYWIIDDSFSMSGLLVDVDTDRILSSHAVFCYLDRKLDDRSIFVIGAAHALRKQVFAGLSQKLAGNCHGTARALREVANCTLGTGIGSPLACWRSFIARLNR